MAKPSLGPVWMATHPASKGSFRDAPAQHRHTARIKQQPSLALNQTLGPHAGAGERAFDVRRYSSTFMTSLLCITLPSKSDCGAEQARRGGRSANCQVR